ncbi:MAG: RDD family protein [Pseudomonadota bacterium]|nr:RDD family protein [Pseudomonadota bacterium]
MPTEPGTEGGRFGASLDVTIDLPLADVGSRGLARAVDAVVYLFVQLAFAVVLAFALGLGYAADIAGLGLLAGVFFILYFVFQWSLGTTVELWMRGQTPGKKLLGLRTVRDDGGSLTLVPALLRNLLRVDSFPVISLLDLVVMYLHPSGKRLGDLAAGTVVVDEGRAAEARTWPPALPAADVALLQIWFARAPDLLGPRRAAIAARLVARLAKGHPGLLDAALLEAGGQPVGALERLAPRAGTPVPVKPPVSLVKPASVPPAPAG